MRVDLHIHTNASHGIWSLSDAYEYVRHNELILFSVTEQDFPRTLRVPADLSRRYIPGVEVAANINNRCAHLLVYGAVDARSDLAVALNRQRRRRTQRVEQILIRLAENNVVVTLADVLGEATIDNRSLSSVHVARALVRLHFAETVEEAFVVYLAPGKPAYVPLKRIAVYDAIEMAHRAGGIVVAAHPARLESHEDLDRLRAAGIDGVEVWHPTADRATALRLRQYANQWNLLETSGSDAGSDGNAELQSHEVQYDRVRVSVRASPMRRWRHG